MLRKSLISVCGVLAGGFVVLWVTSCVHPLEWHWVSTETRTLPGITFPVFAANTYADGGRFRGALFVALAEARPGVTITPLQDRRWSLGPFGLTCFPLFGAPPNLRFGNVYGVLLALWGPAGLLAVWPCVAFLRGPVRRYARRRHGRCVRCGYLLTGLPEPRCPECGTPVTAVARVR